MEQNPQAPRMARPIRVPFLGINVVPAGIVLDILNGFTRGVGLTLGFVAVRAAGAF